MTSKERAELKSQAMRLDSIFQIGKSSLTPQMTEAIKDAIEARELIKISVLKNCADDPRELAEMIADRTGSQVVQVIGKKIVLYKLNPDKEQKRRKKEATAKKSATAAKKTSKETTKKVEKKSNPKGGKKR